jgi:glucokinase
VQRTPEGTVVVTGLPASGKSTTARALAEALAWTLFDKDEFLEELFDELPPMITPPRRRSSRRADQMMLAAARHEPTRVVVSHWRHRDDDVDSGTPIELLDALSPLVEVHCVCPVDVAVERFLTRRRHRGHDDAGKSDRELAAQFERYASRGSLTDGPVIVVDTTAPIDVAALAEQCRRALWGE